MSSMLLTIPVAFLVLLVSAAILMGVCSRLAARPKGADKTSRKAYSCGEEFEGHLIQPDYSQFFSFALFFTVLHVVALMIATVPKGTPETVVLALFYVLGAIVGLRILLKR